MSGNRQDIRPSKIEQEGEKKIESIVDSLTEEQIATAKVIEERLQQGLKNIDADLLDYIQKLPTITSTSTTSTTNEEPNWRTLSDLRLLMLLERHNLLGPDEGDIPSREKMLSMLSITKGRPPTLDPLFKAQRAFKENIKRLNSIVRKLLLVMEEIPEPAQTDTLRKAIADANKLKISSDEEKFYIIVFGELKAGKSSCLNFLLEDDVLPTDSAACTVVVTELHYGNTRKLKTVDSKTGEVCDQPLDLSKGSTSKILAEFLNEQNPDRCNPVYSKIILELPSPILQAGIVFVDTPGLSENSYLEDMVDKYMTQVVGALLILNSSADGGHVRPSLADRLAILDATDGLEVAFICNRIDQVDDAAKIMSLYRNNLQTNFPKRFRSEFVVPFDAKGALKSKQEGLQTAAQTEFVNKIVQYLETSFRSRLQILFDCVLSYTQVNQPIIHCFKFDLQSISNAFSSSYQNREKTAKMLTEMMEGKKQTLKSLEDGTRNTIRQAIASAEGMYGLYIKGVEHEFLEFAAKQIDITDDSGDRRSVLINRLLDFFSVKVNALPGYKYSCLKKITDTLNTYANQVRSILDDMQQFCLHKWTAKQLQMWHEYGDEAKNKLIRECLTIPTNNVTVRMSNPAPVVVKKPNFAVVAVWNIFNTDTWRRDIAQAWINNDLHKTQTPLILFSIRQESEARMNELTKIIAERLSHVQEFIANINRKSVFHTMELCQTLLKHTTIIEEEAAKFAFDTVKKHLDNVTISGKLIGTNVWRGKWGDVDVALKNLTGADATYYSRFLEQEADYKDLNHPNIIKYFGTAIINDIPSVASSNSNARTSNQFLVTEFVPRSLNQCIHDLNADTAASILLGVATGAEHIHTEKKLMHFDFRPENIMLSDDMSPKISDHNLCARNLLSKDHCRTKKMGFIAPELSKGYSCTMAVDIFAFGSLIKCVYGNLEMPEHMTALCVGCCSTISRPQWSLIRESILEKKVPEIDPVAAILVLAFRDFVGDVFRAILDDELSEGEEETIASKDKAKSR